MTSTTIYLGPCARLKHNLQTSLIVVLMVIISPKLLMSNHSRLSDVLSRSFLGCIFPKLDETTVSVSEPVSLCCTVYDFMTCAKDSYSYSSQNETNADIFTPLYLYAHTFCRPSVRSPVSLRHTTVCSNLHVLITFLTATCEQIVTSSEKTITVSVSCLYEPVDDFF